MKPVEFTELVKQALKERLVSVYLYGSAAAGDYTEKHSDFNILLIVSNLSVRTLNIMAECTGKWVKKGNPPPLMFTRERLQQSADVFPVELYDMKQSHQLLFGEDVLQEIELTRKNMRLQIEHELKGNLIQLREQYLLTGGKPKKIKQLMVDSLSSFLVMMRALLRLMDEEVPQKKIDAVDSLKKHVDFDAESFIEVQRLKEGGQASADPGTLFGRYLEAVTAVVDYADQLEKGMES